jgi:hypothetical protein
VEIDRACGEASAEIGQAFGEAFVEIDQASGEASVKIAAGINTRFSCESRFVVGATRQPLWA